MIGIGKYESFFKKPWEQNSIVLDFRKLQKGGHSLGLERFFFFPFLFLLLNTTAK